MVQVGLWLGLFFLISLVYFFKKYSGEKKGIVFKEKKKVIIICFCLWLGSCGSFKIDSALKKAKDEKDRKESAKKYEEEQAKISPEEKKKLEEENKKARKEQEAKAEEMKKEESKKDIYPEDKVGNELKSTIGRRAKDIKIFENGANIQVQAQDGINNKMIVKGMVKDAGNIIKDLETISKENGTNSYEEVVVEFFFDLKGPDGKTVNDKIFRITKSGNDIKPTFIHPVIQDAYSELYN